jgi:hypothetical protein
MGFRSFTPGLSVDVSEKSRRISVGEVRGLKARVEELGASSDAGTFAWMSITWYFCVVVTAPHLE